MPGQHCKWVNPLEWLVFHITKATRAGIFAIAIRLACQLDADAIQDLYQDEMDDDGYFEEAQYGEG